MTLVITAITAVIVTLVRFAKPRIASRFHLGALALIYWGASLMWSIDGFAAMAEGEAFVELADSAAVADDALLGFCVVILGLVTWSVVLFVKRPRNKSEATIA